MAQVSDTYMQSISLTFTCSGCVETNVILISACPLFRLQELLICILWLKYLQASIKFLHTLKVGLIFSHNTKISDWNPKQAALLWSAHIHGCFIIFLKHARSHENETSERDVFRHRPEQVKCERNVLHGDVRDLHIDLSRSVIKRSTFIKQTLTVYTHTHTHGNRARVEKDQSSPLACLRLKLSDKLSNNSKQSCVLVVTC